MKRKIVSILLCGAMTAGLFAGCGSSSASTEDAATEEASEEATEEAATDEASEEATEETADSGDSAIPEDNIVKHFTFDEGADEGIVAVKQVEASDKDKEDPQLAGATFKLEEDDSLSEIYADGVNGNSLYVNGNYGYKLPVEDVDIPDDKYTISFWINASRLATYGPTVQIGHNIGGLGNAGEEPYVSWINFTQTEWGTDSAKIFPVVWNRNSETDTWPWVYAADDSIHGKQEWCMVTIETTGDTYNATDDGLPRVASKFYLNGQLAFDCSDTSQALYGGLAQHILTGDGMEGYIGINYWDTIFKGFIDDMYIFNTNLSDDQVAALYAQGDPSVQPTAPDGADDLGK